MKKGKQIVLISAATVIIVLAFVAVVAMEENRWQKTSSETQAYCSPTGKIIDTQTAQSHRNFCIQSDTSTKKFVPGVPLTYTFTIIDDQGATVKDFETVHTKLMHFIVARKDLGEFQHLHPEFDPATGEFVLKDLTFPSAGEYRLFADFTPSGGQLGDGGMPLGVTIYEDLAVGDARNVATKPIDTEARTQSVDSYDITLLASEPLRAGEAQQLSFTLRKDDTPVTDLEEYLGAFGHMVVLREGTLDFIHAHPLDGDVRTGRVDFAVTFPTAGKYKLFSQFQHQGRVLTAAFGVAVDPGEDTGSVDHSTMDHSTMNRE